jgi:protein CpxP
VISIERFGAINMKSIRNGLAAGLVAGAALLAAAGNFSTANAADDTAATPPPPGPGHHGWGHGDRGPMHLYSKLGLTPEQQSSIKAIMVAAKPQMKSLHDQMHANHLKMMQTKPDDPNYANVSAEVAQSEATLASRRTQQASELRAQMYAVLTPAQKTQLAALEAERQASPHRQWHGDQGAPTAP